MVLLKLSYSAINEEFIYSPEFTNKGLDFLISTKVDLYRYSDGNYQNLFTLKAGPKIMCICGHIRPSFAKKCQKKCQVNAPCSGKF